MMVVLWGRRVRDMSAGEVVGIEYFVWPFHKMAGLAVFDWECIR